jgi:diaminohydroxyphosphoribosylaminopyrimidine deaminase/5-amino-6-(5-phosphoribosylamino)uracil reductase
LPEDERFMRRALELAARGLGQTSPNPAVGAVVVQSGGIVGEGWHEYAGGPHAEVNALRAAGKSAYGATMYVTLEPCNTQGRTPPCTNAIVEAGIAKVAVGTTDPNPQVSGRGILALRAAGIAVEEGPLRDEIRLLNEAYNKHIVTGMPFVTLKLAMSLDGKIATKTGSSRWITGEAARERAHRLRSVNDVVLTGMGTILADNPRLDVRLEGYRGRQPARVVVDGRGRVPADALVVESAGETPTIIATTDLMSLEKSQALADAGAEVMVVPRVEERIDLKRLLRDLGQRGFNSIMIEAGAALATAFITEELVDKYVFFIAPKLIGGTAALGFYGGIGVEDIKDARGLRFANCETVGDDIMIEAYPVKTSEK